MARQNLHLLKASLGWRELEPAAYTFEKSAAFEVTQTRNLSGLDLGQLYELNGRLQAAQLRVDPRSPPMPARRASTIARWETAPRCNARVSWAGVSSSRAIRAAWSTPRSPTRRSSWARESTRPPPRPALVVHALRQLDIELLPQVTWSAGEYRYARQVGRHGSDPYYFGKLTAKSVSATLRASVHVHAAADAAGVRAGVPRGGALR